MCGGTDFDTALAWHLRLIKKWRLFLILLIPTAHKLFTTMDNIPVVVYNFKRGYVAAYFTNEQQANAAASMEDIIMEDFQFRAEESIRKKFHKQLFSPFARACKNYELIQDGDHIAVCISGGKDSMLMAKLFQEIQRHRKVSFELTFWLWIRDTMRQTVS